MKPSLAGSTSASRAPRTTTLRLRRLAGAAVVGAVVLVASTSQAPASRVAAAAPVTAPDEASTSTDLQFLPPAEPAPWAATEWSAPLGSGRGEDASLAAASVASGTGFGAGANGITAVASADTTEIPSGALAAYQRAAVVIDEAMPSCHISWELVAAVGRVESDHGRYGGSVPDADGVSTPSIIGPALTGRNGTSRITDSDAGLLDGDQKFDHAVGPMQFLPSTWSVVGVDADGDGERNPQDIDDAALAAAVYLCSNDDDLATETGQHDAVFSYNRSESYVETVLALMNAYAAGESPSAATAPASTVQLGSSATVALPATAGDLSGAVDYIDSTTKRTASTKTGAKRDGDAAAKGGGGKTAEEPRDTKQSGDKKRTPGGNEPDRNKPDGNKPDSNKPGTHQPDKNKPGTEKPDPQKPDPEKPEPPRNPSDDGSSPAGDGSSPDAAAIAAAVEVCNDTYYPYAEGAALAASAAETAAVAAEAAAKRATDAQAAYETAFDAAEAARRADPADPDATQAAEKAEVDAAAAAKLASSEATDAENAADKAEAAAGLAVAALDAAGTEYTTCVKDIDGYEGEGTPPTYPPAGEN